MLQLNAINGPYVVCDQCKSIHYLSGNCIPRYGTKFLKPQLAKYGMKIQGPHICKDCKPSVEQKAHEIMDRYPRTLQQLS